MTDNDDGRTSSSLRRIPFDGTRYNVWKTKAHANACRYGYENILSGEEKIPTKIEYQAVKLIKAETRDASQTQIYESYPRNTRAYAEIITNMDDRTPEGFLAWKIIDDCKTTDNPDGDAKLAWDSLKVKYVPKNNSTYNILSNKFQASYLKESEDPVQWITNLNHLATKMNEITKPGVSLKSQGNVIQHILANAGTNYWSID